MSANQQPPRPGWYTAPDGAPYLRWWAGDHWTPQTRPLPQAPTMVVSPGPQRSVYKQRRHTSHTFHLLMTIFTGGIWGLFVWLPMTIWHAMGPRRKVVTRYR